MNAIVYEKFGTPEVLKLGKIEIPVINEDQILIKTYASSVNMIDVVFRSGLKAIFGLARLATGIRRPKKSVLGFDIVGEVVEIGKNITEFKVGDQVYGGSVTGANAEFAIGNEDRIAIIPDNMSHDDAVGIPMVGLIALQALRDSGNIKDGQNVLIYGASSGTGIYVIQLAKYFGTAVTAVASGKNEQILQNLGIDTFIDYKKDDFSKNINKYDLIVDTVGKISHSKWKKSLKKDGIFVNVGSPSMSITKHVLSILGNHFRSKKYKSVDTKYLRSDLEFLAKLYTEGKLKTIIDKSYSLENMAEAHQYYERGRTVGKIIINISN